MAIFNCASEPLLRQLYILLSSFCHCDSSFRERGLPETKGSKRLTMLNSQAEAEMLHTLKSNRGPTKGDVVSSYTRLWGGLIRWAPEASSNLKLFQCSVTSQVCDYLSHSPVTGVQRTSILQTGLLVGPGYLTKATDVSLWSLGIHCLLKNSAVSNIKFSEWTTAH